jgi:hypothetical protein
LINDVIAKVAAIQEIKSKMAYGTGFKIEEVKLPEELK